MITMLTNLMKGCGSMFKIRIFLFGFLIMILSSELYSANRGVMIYFDFQTGFKGQTVTLVVDGKTLLEKKNVKTNQLLDLAFQHSYNTNFGSKKITVIVDGKDIISQELKIETDIYLGIIHNGDHSILLISKKKFLYD